MFLIMVGNIDVFGVVMQCEEDFLGDYIVVELKNIAVPRGRHYVITKFRRLSQDEEATVDAHIKLCNNGIWDCVKTREVLGYVVQHVDCHDTEEERVIELIKNMLEVEI